MYAIDFEYDNKYLSDFGFIICNFDYSNGADEIETGSIITFNKVTRSSGKIFSLTSTKYNECITCTFDICKNPDIYDAENMEIYSYEFTELIRWLNRRNFFKFQFLDNSRDEFEKNICYYNASFNVSKIKINDILYGIRLTMETNAPFGYGEEQNIIFNFNDDNKTHILYDVSEEIGYIYPTIIITCNENGDLSLYNELEKCTTSIKNCKVGEVITLYGDTQIIATTYSSHDICNDFNYDFFRIGNTMTERCNRISASISCDVSISYTPIIKNVF